MSVQLILYPQNYQGQYSSIATANILEYVADSNFSAGIDTVSTTTASDPLADRLTNAPSTIGLWRGYSTNGSPWTTADAPTSSLNAMVLDSGTGGDSYSGIYQTLCNLIAGNEYDLTITHSAAAGGFILIGTDNFTDANGNIPIIAPNNNPTTSNVTETTLKFTALASTQILGISYINDDGTRLTISEVSVKDHILQINNSVFTELRDGQVIVDLYEDEDIPLSLSIDDFTKFDEKIQSYSKSFDLPATKRNNKIFSNIFDVTRTYSGISFNPYAQTKAVLKQDSFTIFDGYLQLTDILTKNNQTSYTVNLYCKAISLIDEIKERTIGDLTALEELAHSYKRTNIQDSWGSTGLLLTTPLPAGSFAGVEGATRTQVLKYPFCNWVGNIQKATTASAGTGGMPQLEKLEDAFRPWINVRYLLDNIFADSSYTFSSTLFDDVDFKKLYMDFSWGAGTMPGILSNSEFSSSWTFDCDSNNFAIATYTKVRQCSTALADGGWTTPPNYDASTYIITATEDVEIYEIDYKFTFSNSNTSVPADCFARWRVERTDGSFESYEQLSITNFQPSSSIIYADWEGSFSISLNTGDKLWTEFKNTQFSTSTGGATRQVASTPESDRKVNWKVTTQTTLKGGLLTTQRGDISQADFLKGIMKMFNAVALEDPENSNNIIIETYNDIFVNNSDATTRYWTDKVDSTEIKLQPLTDLKKELVVKYEYDENDFSSVLYKNTVTKEYGGAYRINYETNALIDKEEVIASPFAATVMRPIHQNLAEFVVPNVYSGNQYTNVFSSYDSMPRILYDVGERTMSSTTYYIPAQNGDSAAQTGTYGLFSHTKEVPTTVSTIDYNFETLQTIGLGAPPIDNLFNKYWLTYYSSLYSPDTKKVILKMNLSPADINTFKFYDIVMIRNRHYRCNKIDYKPNSLATVELILIP
tara:strand:- start:2737 stop:5523 length:2787 start_codon:yes stop_codon:yes gene_type:complete